MQFEGAGHGLGVEREDSPHLSEAGLAHVLA